MRQYLRVLKYYKIFLGVDGSKANPFFLNLARNLSHIGNKNSVKIYILEITLKSVCSQDSFNKSRKIK
jgi:hypothetical protein